jgi:hypothetical protein
MEAVEDGLQRVEHQVGGEVGGQSGRLPLVLGQPWQVGQLRITGYGSLYIERVQVSLQAVQYPTAGLYFYRYLSILETIGLHKLRQKKRKDMLKEK